MNLTSKVAIVTGAASGLGYATCRVLVESGAKVLGVDVDECSLRRHQSEFGDNAGICVADVSDETSARCAVDAALVQFGAVHVAVNCAGVADAAKTVSRDAPHPSEIWNKVIGINLTGTFNIVRHVALAMIRNVPDAQGERGVIVNTASAAAWQGQVGQAAYSASKAGVIGMTLPVARDLAPHGIRVVAIAPGLFDTAMSRGFSQKILAGMERMFLYPGRMGRPAEFAGLVRHVIENSYLNATMISIDGGIRPSTR